MQTKDNETTQGQKRPIDCVRLETHIREATFVYLLKSSTLEKNTRIKWVSSDHKLLFFIAVGQVFFYF